MLYIRDIQLFLWDFNFIVLLDNQISHNYRIFRVFPQINDIPLQFIYLNLFGLGLYSLLFQLLINFNYHLPHLLLNRRILQQSPIYHVIGIIVKLNHVPRMNANKLNLYLSCYIIYKSKRSWHLWLQHNQIESVLSIINGKEKYFRGYNLGLHVLSQFLIIPPYI